MSQKFEKVTIKDIEAALRLLVGSEKRDGVIHTDGQEGPYIEERINHERCSGGGYSTTGRLFRVFSKVVVELKKRKMVEPMLLMGPVFTRLEVSDVGYSWFRRQQAR